MLNFQPIVKERIPEYRSYYDYTDALGCEFNFVGGYIWSERYLLRAAVFDGTLIKAYFRDDRRVWGYCMPSGKNVRGAVEEIFRDAGERGQEAVIAYMSQAERDRLETLFPNRFEFSREPENQDYIYRSADLAELSGKKYHSKRNHISKFFRTYSDEVKIENLCAGNLGGAREVLQNWYAENETEHADYGECKAFGLALDSFDELGFRGLIIYVGGKPAAVTLGTPISGRCFDVMFEKALREYDGIYAVINNEFAKTLTDYEFLNREEDLGLEGLRKAKLSYHPAIIYDRYSAVQK